MSLARSPGGALASALLLLFARPAAAVDETPFRFEPGPSVMSEEERAITADPASGLQHAVVLVEEAERDDTFTGLSKTSFRLRAKILSNEARALADVEIPFESKRGYLTKWWGKVLLPDGTVREVKKEDLKEQPVVEAQGLEARVLRTALPGVVPGCVIEYGYSFRDRSMSFFRRLPVQREWPIRSYRFRWVPAAGLVSQYYVRRRTGVSLEASKKGNAVLIEGRDIPPMTKEPFMPPDDVVRAGATLYYAFLTARSAADPNAFWEEQAKQEEERLREFIKKDEPLKAALAGMGLPQDAPLQARLRAVYDWMGSNVRDLREQTSEEREAAAGKERKEREKREEPTSAAEVLAGKEGWGWQIDALFAGFARVLGAEANLVMAPDRTIRYWDRGLLSTAQLSGDTLVALRAPGGPPGSGLVVDPCSGLPFGEIPWRLTPTKAMLVTTEGDREIVLAGSDARRNVLQTEASLRPEEGGARAVFRWSASGSGQRGREERSSLRWSAPKDRQERLERICGERAGADVSRAEAPGLEDAAASYRIECEGEMALQDAPGGGETIALRIDGPWLPPVPEFASETRVHPVVFSFPFVDLSTVEVSAPEGFAPSAPPPDVKIEARFGSYQLKATPSAGGFRVERAFAIVAATLKAEEYDDLKGFLADVRRADRTTVAFERLAPQGP